jgi:hypothetical protein
MSHPLLKFQNGPLIEIDATTVRAGPVSDSMATRVGSSIDKAMKNLGPLISPICNQVRTLAAANDANTAEVTIGVSFTAEGTLYIVKGSSEASVDIKLVLNLPKNKSE